MTSSQPVMDRVLPQVNYFTPFPYRMNPNIHTRGGYTPLHLSAMHKRDKVYQLLLQTYGADPDRRDYSGYKPQHYLTSSSDKVGEDYLLFDGLGGEDLPDIVNKMDDNSTVASEATEETSRLLMTDECDGSSLNHENGYAKLKRNKNKVGTLFC